MKKKLFLIGLVLVALTAGIMTMSMRRIVNSVLQKGSLEDFSALTLSEEPLYRDEASRTLGGSTKGIWQYLYDEKQTLALWQQLGNVQYVKEETGGFALLHVKEPSEQLRAQLQAIPEIMYSEIVLAKCDFSLPELAEADEKLNGWLKEAPKSVRDSVQLVLVMPDQNRVAVYVKNWSGSDHSAMAEAMGADCPKFYIIEGDLRKTTNQIRFFDRNEELDPELAEAYSKARYTAETTRVDEKCEKLLNAYTLIYSADDPRLLVLRSIKPKPYDYGIVQNEDYGFFEASYSEMSHYVENVYYTQWTDQLEFALRAILNSVAPDQKWTVFYQKIV